MYSGRTIKRRQYPQSFPYLIGSYFTMSTLQNTSVPAGPGALAPAHPCCPASALPAALPGLPPAPRRLCPSHAPRARSGCQSRCSACCCRCRCSPSRSCILRRSCRRLVPARRLQRQLQARGCLSGGHCCAHAPQQRARPCRAPARPRLSPPHQALRLQATIHPRPSTALAPLPWAAAGPLPRPAARCMFAGAPL